MGAFILHAHLALIVWGVIVEAILALGRILGLAGGAKLVCVFAVDLESLQPACRAAPWHGQKLKRARF